MILIVNKTQTLINNCQLLNDVMFRYDVVGRPGRMLYDDTGICHKLLKYCATSFSVISSLINKLVF